MAYRSVVPALVAVVFLARPASGHLTQPAAGQPVLVRVSVALVPPVPRSHRQLRAMIQEAEAIWHPYGVALLWLTPWTIGSMPPADIRLRVEFARHARPKSSVGDPDIFSLGAIQFLDGVPDDLITLSADEITTMVLSIPWDGRPLNDLPPALVDDMNGRAFGRVLAHELGHYLLASGTHTQEGLMRPSYPTRELADWDRRGFRLDAVARLRFRARLAELLAAQPAGR